MENTPKNVFIPEDGKYKEITNTEHSRRRKNENAYKKRKFIRMGNCWKLPMKITKNTTKAKNMKNM